VLFPSRIAIEEHAILHEECVFNSRRDLRAALALAPEFAVVATLSPFRLVHRAAILPRFYQKATRLFHIEGSASLLHADARTKRVPVAHIPYSLK